MRIKTLSVHEQRDRISRNMVNAINLEFHLRNLLREIRNGELQKLVEFQQFIQYAPTETKIRIMEQLDVERYSR
jgi:predicted RNA-binding protein